VICSPNARKSRWVNEEILLFKRLGRENDIFALIVGGEPNDSDISGPDSALECFPKSLLFRLDAKGNLSDQRIDPAAADARPHGDGKENAKLKLIAGLIGADYDALKQRDLEYVRRRTRLYGIIAVSMGVLAVVAVAGGALAYYYALRSQEMTQQAVIQARTAERTTKFMVSLFSIADPEQNRGETVTAREMLDRGVRSVETGLNGEDVVRANLLRAMGEAYGGLGLYPKADAALSNAVRAAKKGGTPEDVLKANLALAANKYADGQYDAARQIYQDALTQAQRLPGPDRPEVVEALEGLGSSEAGLSRDGQAETHYRSALAIAVRTHGEENVDVARILNSLATLLYAEARFAEAATLYQRSLAIRLKFLGPRDANVAISLNNLGALEYQMGNYARAEDYYQRALPVYQAVYGRKHPQIAVLLNNMGRLQLMRNERSKARAAFTEALAIDRKSLTADDDALVPILNSLGMLALAGNDLESANSFLPDALQIAAKRKSQLLDQVLGNVSDLRMRQGHAEEAKDFLSRARETQASQYGAKLNGADAWRAAVLAMIEASNNISAGNLKDAKSKALYALPILKGRFGSGGFYTQRVIGILMEVFQREGHLSEAEKYRSLLTANAR
jgi:tetratricopeptide (TPR) repeat protein